MDVYSKYIYNGLIFMDGNFNNNDSLGIYNHQGPSGSDNQQGSSGPNGSNNHQSPSDEDKIR